MTIQATLDSIARRLLTEELDLNSPQPSTGVDDHRGERLPKNGPLGGAYSITTEFVLFARRGSLKPLRRMDSTWWQMKRPYNHNGAPAHSAKPEAFLDLVEQVSPGPYVELFARRARFGWDYWGDQSLGTAEMPREAA